MIYRDLLKPLLSLNQLTVEKLAQKMSEKLNKKYTRSSLNGKFARDTLSMKECQVIAEILGYHIEFVKNKNVYYNEHRPHSALNGNTQKSVAENVTNYN